MDCFRTVRAEFQDFFCIVRAKFSGLFANSPDRIFGTIFRQSWTVLRFGFDPKTDVFEFCGVFWYSNNSVTNREGTRGVLFYVGLRFGPFCVLLL